MVSGSLALLFFLLGFHGGRQGSGPDRGQSPVECGIFCPFRTFVRTFVRPSIRSPLWAIHPGLAGWASDLAGWAFGLAGWASGLAGWPRGGDGRTNVRTDGKSPHSTGLRPLSGPLPKNE